MDFPQDNSTNKSDLNNNHNNNRQTIVEVLPINDINSQLASNLSNVNYNKNRDQEDCKNIIQDLKSDSFNNVISNSTNNIINNQNKIQINITHNKQPLHNVNNFNENPMHNLSQISFPQSHQQLEVPNFSGSFINSKLLIFI